MGHAGNVRGATSADLAVIISLLADDVLGEVREPGKAAAHAYRRAFAEIDADPAHHLAVAEIVR